MTKPIIGYLERVTLNDLDIHCHAKIDTGACSSSIHAEHIEVFQRDDADWVRFHVLFRRGESSIDRVCEAPVLTRKTIASSNGSRSHRYVIHTHIELAGQTWPIELNLSHRGSMKYPMLLGREAFAGRFLVDVEHTYLGS